MSSEAKSSQPGTNATATGVGASVRRREDLRFITGKGQYTDDISRPGETRAMFVRSPHAHARIKNVDTKAAAAMPGVLAVLTGAQLASDKIGNLICGWMIHSKDGSPMKMAAHPARPAMPAIRWRWLSPRQWRRPATPPSRSRSTTRCLPR
jgi:CO/xanthine dehydrogenase Mo-binding subunit